MDHGLNVIANSIWEFMQMVGSLLSRTLGEPRVHGWRGQELGPHSAAFHIDQGSYPLSEHFGL